MGDGKFQAITEVNKLIMRLFVVCNIMDGGHYYGSTVHRKARISSDTVRSTKAISQGISLFDFSKNDDFITVGAYKLGYIPSEYQLIESRTTEGYEINIFSNGNDDINLLIMSSSISEVKIDHEKRRMQPIKLKSYVTYALQHNDSSEPTILVWGDKDRSFSLTGKLSLDELTKIAKSFK